MKQIKYLIITAIFLLVISACKPDDLPDDVAVDTVITNSNLSIPKTSLQFHGLAENYDFVKGIWYDANSSNNNFNTFKDYLHPLKYINGKLLNTDIPTECTPLLKNTENQSELPYIRTYHNGYFKFSQFALGTSNNTDFTFVAVIKPLGIYNDEMYNPIITEKENQNVVNNNFTNLRIYNYDLCLNQRSSGFDTKDTRSGKHYMSQKAESKLQCLIGISKGNKLFLYRDGVLISECQKDFNSQYFAQNTTIGGSLPANVTENDPIYFDGLYFEVLIYNEALNSSELNQLNGYLLTKYNL